MVSVNSPFKRKSRENKSQDTADSTNSERRYAFFNRRSASSNNANTTSNTHADLIPKNAISNPVLQSLPNSTQQMKLLPAGPDNLAMNTQHSIPPIMSNHPLNKTPNFNTSQQQFVTPVSTNNNPAMRFSNAESQSMAFRTSTNTNASVMTGSASSTKPINNRYSGISTTNNIGNEVTGSACNTTPLTHINSSNSSTPKRSPINQTNKSTINTSTTGPTPPVSGQNYSHSRVISNTSSQSSTTNFLAEQYERDRKNIILTCFSKPNPNTFEPPDNYITHVRITEDSKYQNSRPPLDSNLKNKKQRMLIMSAKAQDKGVVLLHKAKESQPGYFQIGRTWNLKELTSLERDPEIETGFICHLGKPYYWKTRSTKERTVFVKSIVNVYMQAFDGRVPQLINWNLRIFHLDENSYQRAMRTRENKNINNDSRISMGQSSLMTPQRSSQFNLSHNSPPLNSPLSIPNNIMTSPVNNRISTVPTPPTSPLPFSVSTPNFSNKIDTTYSPQYLNRATTSNCNRNQFQQFYNNNDNTTSSPPPRGKSPTTESSQQLNNLNSPISKETYFPSPTHAPPSPPSALQPTSPLQHESHNPLNFWSRNSSKRSSREFLRSSNSNVNSNINLISINTKDTTTNYDLMKNIELDQQKKNLYNHQQMSGTEPYEIQQQNTNTLDSIKKKQYLQDSDLENARNEQELNRLALANQEIEEQKALARIHSSKQQTQQDHDMGRQKNEAEENERLRDIENKERQRREEEELERIRREEEENKRIHQEKEMIQKIERENLERERRRIETERIEEEKRQQQQIDFERKQREDVELRRKQEKQLELQKEQLQQIEQQRKHQQYMEHQKNEQENVTVIKNKFIKRNTQQQLHSQLLSSINDYTSNSNSTDNVVQKANDSTSKLQNFLDSTDQSHITLVDEDFNSPPDISLPKITNSSTLNNNSLIPNTSNLASGKTCTSISGPIPSEAIVQEPALHQAPLRRISQKRITTNLVEPNDDQSGSPVFQKTPAVKKDEMAQIQGTARNSDEPTQMNNNDNMLANLNSVLTEKVDSTPDSDEFEFTDNSELPTPTDDKSFIQTEPLHLKRRSSDDQPEKRSYTLSQVKYPPTPPSSALPIAPLSNSPVLQVNQQQIPEVRGRCRKIVHKPNNPFAISEEVNNNISIPEEPIGSNIPFGSDNSLHEVSSNNDSIFSDEVLPHRFHKVSIIEEEQPDIPQLEALEKEKGTTLSKDILTRPPLIDIDDDEMNEILADINWDGKEDPDEMLDKLDRKIADEKHSLNNNLISLEGSGSTLKPYQLAVTKECEKMDPTISLFLMEMGNVADDIEYIEQQNNGLQVESANKKMLWNTLSQLLNSVSMDQDTLYELLSKPISEHNLGRMDNQLEKLFSALIAIKGEKSSVHDYLGGMSALQQRRQTYEKVTSAFLIRVVDELTKMFSNIEHMKNTQLTNILSRLLVFSSLTRFCKDVSPNSYETIMEKWNETAHNIYSDEGSRLLNIFEKNNNQSFTNNESENMVTLASINKFFVDILQYKKGSLDYSTKLNAAPPELNIVLGILDILETIERECIVYQNFLDNFFHLSDNRDFSKFIAQYRDLNSRVVSLEEIKTMDSDRKSATLINELVSKAFHNTITDISSYLVHRIKELPSISPSLLMYLQSRSKALENSNQEYLLGATQRLINQIKQAWLDFVKDESIFIERAFIDYSDISVAPFLLTVIVIMKNTEEIYSRTKQLVLGNESLENDETLLLVHKGFENLGIEIVHSLSKPSDTISQNPSADVSKKLLSLILNSNWLIKTFAYVNVNDVLNQPLVEIKITFDNYKELYVTHRLRQTMPKLTSFVSGALNLLRNNRNRGTLNPARRAAYSKQNLDNMLSGYTPQEIDNLISKLHQQVVTDFNISSSDIIQDTLIEKIWSSLQGSTVSLYLQLATLMEKNYRGSILQFSKNDIILSFEKYRKQTQ